MANNDVFSAVKVMATDLTNEANEIAADVQKSRVNVNKVVHEIRKDEATTDTKVKAYQERMAKAQEQIEKWTSEVDEYIKTNLVSASSMSDEVYEAKKTKYAELKKSIKNTLSLAASLPGYSAELFTDVPALQTLSGGTSAGGSTGTKRPRLAEITVNGTPTFTVKNEGKEDESKAYTFTAAAAHISKDSGVKVQPSDLSAAAFAAAGSDDLSSVTSVEFNYSAGDKEYALVAIPAAANE
jgi:uncharacterized protein YhaN